MSPKTPTPATLARTVTRLRNRIERLERSEGELLAELRMTEGAARLRSGEIHRLEARCSELYDEARRLGAELVAERLKPRAPAWPAENPNQEATP